MPTAAAVVMLLAPPASADSSTITLNEINCENADWIELANPTDAAVSVGGWLLTDDAVDRNPPRADHRFTLPAGASVPAHGTLLVESGAEGFAFGIKCGDDTIRLADTASVLVDSFVVPVLPAAAATLGRVPDGTGAWTGTASTPGAPNSLPDESQTSTDSAWLFDPLSVTSIALAATPQDLADLSSAPEEYVPATITITRGATVYGPYDVGLRLKGHGSFRTLAGKASFKVDFTYAASGQRFFGLRALTLNSMVQDPSMVSEAVAYEFSRSVGLPAARSGYSWVMLNGAIYGLYADVETLDEAWAARTFTSTSHIYEGDINTDLTSPLDIDAGSSTDTSDLAALAAAATTNGPGWWAAMTSVADMAEMTRMWAVEHVISQWDGYSVGTPNNYYLHSDESGRFTMIPTGLDQTWGNDVLLGQLGSGVLFGRCAASPDCRAAYEAAMADIADWLETHPLAARAAALATAVHPFMVADPRKEQAAGVADADAAAAVAAIEGRAAQIRAWLAAPTYAALGGPGSGSGGSSGGTDTEGPSPVPAPAAVAPMPAVPAQPAATAPVAPAMVLTAGSSSTVAQSRPVTPTPTARHAPVVSTQTGRLVTIRVRGLAAGRHRTWLALAPGWHALGRTVVADSGRGAVRAIGVSVAGSYLLRLDLPQGSRYVRLIVR